MGVSDPYITFLGRSYKLYVLANKLTYLVVQCFMCFMILLFIVIVVFGTVGNYFQY